MAHRRHLPVTLNKDDTLITVGFTNSKKATERFDKHEKSMSYHQAIDLVEKIPQTTMNVADMLSSHLAGQKAENREMLKIILSSICYLARQGLALRGCFKTASNSDVSGKLDSNLYQLLKNRAEDNPKLLKWMDKRRDKFMSPDIQNEILGIMAQFIQ